VLAACSAWRHAPTDPRWLAPRPALLPEAPAGSASELRVAVYGDTRGNRTTHRAVAAAIARERPDLVVFTGDALECLPVGHMPDLGGWQYAIPFWPQYHRRYPVALLASLVPFPAGLHDTVGTLVAPARDPAGFNAFLEDSGPARERGAPLLFVAGNHDLYHRSDREALGRLLGSPPDRLWYAVDAGPWRFVVLDTGTDLLGDGDPMPEGGAQLRWLDEVLGDAERRGLTPIVAAHLPPYSSAREDGATPWVEERVVKGVLDRQRVPLVLNGHAHAYERVERAGASGRNVTYIVTGGGGATFFHEESQATAGSRSFVEGVPHFVMLELAAGRIRGRMVPVAPPGGEAPRAPPADTFELTLR
jgi:3',5'-cyclic AMP phosphodiesterase CpdA